MEMVRIGLDLAKSVFEVCGVDMRDHVVLRKTLRREAVPQFFAELPPCLIGMEACSSSHYWAKVLTDLGHQVRLIAPQFVTPYVKSNKKVLSDEVEPVSARTVMLSLMPRRGRATRRERRRGSA